MIKQTRMAVGGMGIAAALMVAIWQQEGDSNTAYLDSGGVPTIGPGRTEGVKMGDTTTTVREMVFLLNNLENTYGAGVKRCIKVPLHQHEFDALVDTAYNAGVGAVCRELAPKFNAAKTDEDYVQACSSIRGWRATVKGRDCRIRGNNCYGLVKRREAEYKQCMGRA